MKQDQFKDFPETWRSLVTAHRSYVAAQIQLFSATKRFLDEHIDHVAVIRRALNEGELDVAFYATKYLSADDLRELFPTMIMWAAASERYGEAILNILRSLPQDWVLAHIEQAAEPYLSSESDDYSHAYDLLLALYAEIDAGLALRLARRAVSQSEMYIRRIGEQYLQKINDKG